MEIKKEMLAIVPYLGQQVQISVCKFTLVTKYPENVQDDMITLDAFFNPMNKCKLLLRSLRSISEEDAVELGKIAYEDPKMMKWVEIGKGIITDYLDRGFELSVKSYQFLQSRGYDLPTIYLDGQTLIEAGLAIEKM